MQALALLRGLSLSRIIAGASLIAAALFALLWKAEQAHSAKQKVQIEKLAGELKRISSTRNEQAEVTTRVIEKVRVEYRDAEKQAERIEQAPLPGNCKTPREILGADL